MTIRIEITAETPELFDEYLKMLAGRLVRYFPNIPVNPEPESWHEVGSAGPVIDQPADQATPTATMQTDHAGNTTIKVDAGTAVKRRRTKAEIEAARAAEAPPPLASQTVTRAVSETSEERVGPTDAPEIEDEPKPEQPADAPLTHDNVRSALKAVVDAKGLPFATSLLTKLGFGKVSDIPADKFGEVIEQLKGAAA